MTQPIPITSQSTASLIRKARAHLLPPQICPKCKADLSDPDVTDEYANFAVLFGRAIEIRVSTKRLVWVCPDCKFRFGKHDKP